MYIACRIDGSDQRKILSEGRNHNLPTATMRCCLTDDTRRLKDLCAALSAAFVPAWITRASRCASLAVRDACLVGARWSLAR